MGDGLNSNWFFYLFQMASKELINSIAQGEGYYTEFKRSVNSDLIGKVEKAGLPEVIFHYNYFFAVEFTREDKVEKSSEKSSEKILQIIADKKFISARELAQELNVSQRAVEKNLAILKKEGKLKRIGPAKGGYWEITENKL